MKNSLTYVVNCRQMSVRIQSESNPNPNPNPIRIRFFAAVSFWGGKIKKIGSLRRSGRDSRSIWRFKTLSRFERMFGSMQIAPEIFFSQSARKCPFWKGDFFLWNAAQPPKFLLEASYKYIFKYCISTVPQKSTSAKHHFKSRKWEKIPILPQILKNPMLKNSRIKISCKRSRTLQASNCSDFSLWNSL